VPYGERMSPTAQAEQGWYTAGFRMMILDSSMLAHDPLTSTILSRSCRIRWQESLRIHRYSYATTIPQVQDPDGKASVFVTEDGSNSIAATGGKDSKREDVGLFEGAREAMHRASTRTSQASRFLFRSRP